MQQELCTKSERIWDELLIFEKLTFLAILRVHATSRLYYYTSDAIASRVIHYETLKPSGWCFVWKNYVLIGRIKYTNVKHSGKSGSSCSVTMTPTDDDRYNNIIYGSCCILIGTILYRTICTNLTMIGIFIILFFFYWTFSTVFSRRCINHSRLFIYFSAASII